MTLLKNKKFGLIHLYGHYLSGLCPSPPKFQVEAMIAIGKKGSVDYLDPTLQTVEKKSERKPLTEIISEGVFNFK